MVKVWGEEETVINNKARASWLSSATNGVAWMIFLAPVCY